jgi:hypothetical protein
MMVAIVLQELRLLLELVATSARGERSPERLVEERKPRQPSRGLPWQTGTWIWAEQEYVRTSPHPVHLQSC